MRRVLLALAAIYAAGIWWGVPWAGWAPDEIPPGVFLDSLYRHFAGGWHDKYPPVHFYLNGVLYLPFAIAARFGAINLESLAVQAALLLVSRILSLAMALGAGWAVYRAADDLYGAPGSIFAAAIAGVALPFVFYAKLANVDVPCVFWIAWSMVFYVRLVKRGGDWNAVWFAVTAATAVETKDQAYGFYLLPMLHVAWINRRALLVAMVAGCAAFVLEANLLFNARGFVEHVRAMMGVGADIGFQPLGYGLARQLAIARLALAGTVWSITWLGVAAAIAGIVTELRRRRFLWLLLPVISYYVFFVATIGSVFDRYLLGVYPILAIFTGEWIDAFLNGPSSRRGVRLAACVAGVVVLAWYGASIDLMMLRDSRYAAERWLRERTSPDATIAAIGPRAYLPGVGGRRIVRGLTPAQDIPAAGLPDFVVANEQVMRRGDLPPVDRAWWQWLKSGDAPYRSVATFRTAPRLSLLTYTSTFRNGVEDLYTNLDKVGPPIVVYQRTFARH